MQTCVRLLAFTLIGAHNEAAAFWAAYEAVLPSKRHRAVGKEIGKTSYVERLNNTLKQRVSRLVRKTLSFSKSLENYIGAVWYFIHCYNASLLINPATKVARGNPESSRVSA